MSSAASTERVAHLVDPRAAETIDVLGATAAFLTPLEEREDAPIVIRGTLPAGAVVPLHSHADPETFLALAGEVEGLVDSATGFSWVRIEPGDVFHVPGGSKHAFRNRSSAPAVNLIVTTPRIGRFFREIGRPVGPGSAVGAPPSDEAIRRFLEIAERYGYWNATPEENLEVGIHAPAAA